MSQPLTLQLDHTAAVVGHGQQVWQLDAGSPVVASTALQGHAKQDLNGKLDELAPGESAPLLKI